MKNVKKELMAVLILFFVVSFLSCKNNKTEKEEIQEEMPMDTVSAVFEPFDVIVIALKAS